MFSNRAPVLLIALFLATPARAWDPETECPQAPEDSLKLQMAAGELFAEADAQYSSGRPIEALKKFLCSHHVIQHENTLFNIAQIAKLDETEKEAIALLRDYVRHAEGSHKVDPIQEIIDELENAPAAQEEDVSVAQATGPEEPPPPEPPAQGKEDVQKRRGPPNEPKGTKIAGLALMGTGGAALVVGAVLQGLAGSAKSDAEEAGTLNRFESAESKMKGFQIGALVGFVSGGVLAGVGVSLFIISKKDPNEHTDAAFYLTPHPGGVTLEGSF
jgi:hypothetical protein